MTFKDKTVLVTGGAGVIGRELISKLTSRGANIICYDIAKKPLQFPKSVTYRQYDLSTIDPTNISAIEADYFFHLAATFERTSESPEFWNNNFQNNIILSHKILEGAMTPPHMGKIIFASSYLIYDPLRYLTKKPLNKPHLLSESDPINPRNLIGTSKYYTEKELSFINTLNIDMCCMSARIFRVYGCGSKDIVSRWIRAAINGETLEIYNKKNIFDYIYAGDVAEGLIRLAESGKKSDIVNLGTGMPLSLIHI